MARPTDYTAEIVEKARDYAVNHESYGDAVPTIAGMACEVGVARSTLYDWATHEDKPEFSDIFNMVAEFQERKLVNGGLVGGFNPAVTKMMLTKHGYSDKQEIDHTTAGQPITKIERVIIDPTHAADDSDSNA